MEKKNKGGRPRTDRTKAVTFHISEEAARILDGEHNRSKLIDSLIRGKVARLQCPECGAIIKIKTEE